MTRTWRTVLLLSIVVQTLALSSLHADETFDILPAALQQPAVVAGSGAEGAAGEDKPAKDDLDKLMSMDLDQLQHVDVVQESTPAALTEVPSDRNIVPAAVTHISKEDIWRCGARNLDEVLDIYVPNLEVVRHHWEQTHLGLRNHQRP